MGLDNISGKMYLGNVYWRISHSMLTVRQMTKAQHISDRKGHWNIYIYIYEEDQTL